MEIEEEFKMIREIELARFTRDMMLPVFKVIFVDGTFKYLTYKKMREHKNWRYHLLMFYEGLAFHSRR